MWKLYLLTVVLMVLLGWSLCGRTLHGFASYVYDGDTIKLATTYGEYRVRLYGIDCPERNQTYGSQARTYTMKKTSGVKLKVKVMGKDKYDRIIGKVYVRDTCLNSELLKRGYAWYYVFGSRNYLYLFYELSARFRGVGLWAYRNPMRPADYRKR